MKNTDRFSLFKAPVSIMLLLGLLFAAAGAVRAANLVSWEVFYKGIGSSYTTAMVIDNHGDVIILGTANRTTNPSDFSRDCVTVKYDGATGQQLWAASFHNAVQLDYPKCIAVDANGNVFVSIESPTRTTLPRLADWITLKYDGNTGQQLWIARHDEGAADAPAAMAVDGDGNPIVCGTSVTGVNSHGDLIYRARVIKYSGASGTPIWSAYHDAANGTSAFFNSVVADRNNDVIVAGGIKSPATALTLKYRGDNGGLLWLDAYVLPFATGSVKYLKIDTEGNAFVSADSGSANVASIIIKYDGAMGNRTWVSSSNGVTTCDGFALDGFGNPIVASASGPMAKYEGASGAMLWLNPNAYAGSLTTNPSGSLIAFAYFPRGVLALRSFDDQSGAVIWTLPIEESMYNLAGLGADQTGGIIIARTVWPSGESHYGYATTKFIEPGPNTVPTTPIELTVTLSAGPGVLVHWQDTSNNETGFRVERRTDSSQPFVALNDTAPANALSLLDTTVEGGTSYEYRVVAFNDIGDSEPSARSDASWITLSGLQQIVLASTSVRGKKSVRATAYLSLPEATSQRITLTSDNPLVKVPRTVTIPKRKYSKTFQIRTRRVTAPTLVKISATLGTVTRTVQLEVDP